jgi:polysaccharide export outer membrane protein
MLSQKIRADGLTAVELGNAVSEALKSGQILVDPYVTVTTVEHHLRAPITVLGAVRTPVEFQAPGAITLLEAILRAGGVAPDAGPEILVARTQPKTSESIEPARAGGDEAHPPLIERVLVRSLLDGTDPGANLVLVGGEEVRVADSGKFFVFGNVKKPGTLPVQDPNDSTVFKAVALSEGLAPNAAPRAYIFRREAGAGARNEIPIELKKIMARKAPDVHLVADDILYIPDNIKRRTTLAVAEKAGIVGLALVSTLIYYFILR